VIATPYGPLSFVPWTASTQAVTPSGVADSSTTTLSMMMFCLSGSAPAAQEPAALSAAMQHSARDILRIGALP